MKTIKIIVEKSADYYDAYSDNCDGIYGAGATVEEAKENVLKGLELLINSRDKKDLPAILQGDYSIEFQFDTQSFLNYYNKIFSNVALERLTGVNQKQLHHYSTGLKRPREAQKRRIETALHGLGRELLAVRL